jgi:hypothetical protein
MPETSQLKLPYLEAAQAQKHVTHNEALRILDAATQLAVQARGVLTPPSTLQDGQAWLIGSGAGGAFAGKADQIAVYQEGAWRFLPPKAGWQMHVLAEDIPLLFDGSAWRAPGSGVLANVPMFGLGTAPDVNNPFAAKLNKALWTAKTTGEGGNGDLRYTLNKETSGKVLSLLMQTGFSGRAEFGLIGDDDLSVKVSANGSAWNEAVRIDRNNGQVSVLGNRVLRLVTGTRSVTVPGQYATIQAAIDSFDDFSFGTNGTGEIVIAGGTYVLSGALTCRHPQAEKIVLRAASAVTVPADTALTGVKAADETILRNAYGVKIEVPGSFAAFYHDTGDGYAGTGALGVQDIGFFWTGSSGKPYAVDWRGCIGGGFTRCCFFNFQAGISLSNAAAKLQQCQFLHHGAQGVLATQASRLQMSDCLMHNNADCGLLAQHVSQVTLTNCIAKRNQTGFVARFSSMLAANACMAANNLGIGCETSHGSVATLSTCTLSGNPTQALLVQYNASATVASVTVGGSGSALELRASLSSTIQTSGTHTGSPVWSPAIGATGGNMGSFIQ